jgi:hypothetical protein
MAKAPITIVKDFGFKEANDILEKLYATGEITLKLPLRLEKPKFGARGALLQLLITWAKHTKDREVQTYLGSGVQTSGVREQFLRMRDQGFGLVAGLLAKRLLGHSGIDLTEQCKSHLIKYLESTFNRYREGLRQRARTLVICDDSDGLSYNPLLYTGFAANQIPRVAPDEDMADLVTSVVDHALRLRNLGEQPFSKELFLHIGGILHELFENTDDWAKPPIVSDEPSLRGILFESYIQFVNGPDQAHWLASSEPLAEYVASVAGRGNKKPSFIEISVFDSGPGIAKQWLSNKGRQPDLIPDKDAQYEALITAFRTWSTSSHNAGRGKGLDSVLRLLTKLSGFFFLRTDSLALYRDLLNNPHDPGDYNSAVITPGKVPLKDWTSKGEKLTELPRVEGTLISMLIPLDASIAK